MDDILDLLESNEKPSFQNEGNSAEKPATEWKPKSDWKPRGEWKPNSNYSGGTRKPFVSLWNKKDFTPKEIKISELTRKKAFMVVIANKTSLPDNINKLLVNMSLMLSKAGYTFRCNADKNDVVQLTILNKIKEEGDAAKGDPKFEVYLPWAKFNEDIEKPTMTYPNEAGYSIAVNMHNTFYDQKESVRAIISRDVHMSLGTTGTEAVEFMVIYTECGSESIGQHPDYRKLGNATFYIKLAEKANIPVFNVKNPESIKRLSEFIKSKQALAEVTGEE